MYKARGPLAAKCGGAGLDRLRGGRPSAHMAFIGMTCDPPMQPRAPDSEALEVRGRCCAVLGADGAAPPFRFGVYVGWGLCGVP